MKHQGVERDDLADNVVDEARDCPIRKLESHLEGIATPRELDEIREGARRQVEEAIAFALASPFPAQADLLREA